MKTLNLNAISLAMVSLFSATSIAATQPSDIEVIEITAKPFEVPVSSLPGTVQLISQAEIQAQAAVSADVSSLLANLVPSYSPETQMLSSTYQGFRGRKSIVMIDGIVVSNSLRETSRVLASISVENIARIEVIHGASAVYGNGESAGVINLVTHQASDLNVEFWSQVKFDGSIHDSDSHGYQFNQRISGTVDQFSYLGQLNWRESGEIFDGNGNQIPSDPAGRGGLGELKDIDGLLKFTYQLNQDADLALNAHYRKLENELSFGRKTIFDNVVVVDPTKPFTGDAPYSENQYLQLEFNHQRLSNHKVNIELSVANSENTQANTVKVESDKFALRFAAQPLSLPRSQDVFTYGIDYQIDETTQHSSRGICEICDVEQTNLAPFAEYQFNFDNFMVQVGARYENFDLDVPSYVATGRYGDAPFFGQQINGGELSYNKTVFNVGAVYRFTETEVYGSFSQGYGLGDLRRLRSINVNDVDNYRQALQPVEADNYELGLRGQINAFSFDLSLYYTDAEHAQSYVDITDQVIYASLQQVDPRLTYDLSQTFNPDAIDALVTRDERTYGAEFSYAYSFTDSLDIGGTLSHSEGKYRHPTSGWIDLNHSRLSPFKATLYANLELTDKLGANIQINHIGSRGAGERINLAIPQNGAFGTFEGYQYYGAGVEGYTTVDLSMYYNTDMGDFKLGIKNLFDRVYLPTYAQQGSGSVYGQIDLPPNPALDQIESLVRDFAFRDSYNAQGTTFTLSYSVAY
ncbi:TonB-dependent receptor [Thalassotalea montiporae]